MKFSGKVGNGPVNKVLNWWRSGSQRNMGNTIQRFMCGDDAAVLLNYFGHLLLLLTMD